MKIKIEQKINRKYALMVGIAGIISILVAIGEVIFISHSIQNIFGAGILILLGLFLIRFWQKYYIKKLNMEQILECESYEILN